MKRLFLLLLTIPFIIAASCPVKPSPDKCVACDLYVNPEVKKLCKDNFCPKPTATALPTVPVSTPTPTPKPTIGDVPTPIGTIPWNTACVIPNSVTDNCKHTTTGQQGVFTAVAKKAQVNVFQKYPSLFTYVGKSGCEWQVVDIKDQDKYYWNIALEVVLLNKKACAQFDGENVSVKSDNTLSEGYHVLINDGCVNDPNGIFTWSCSPSAF